MNRPVALALLLVAAIVAASLLWTGSDEPRQAPASPGSVEETPLAPTEDVVALDPSAEAPARTEVAPASIPTFELPADQEAVEAATDEPDLAHVVGRLLTPGGAPAAGAELKIGGWGANSERTRKYGEPEDWEDVTGVTGPDGRFDLAFDPPRAYQFTLDASYPGHASLSWRWSSLPVAETTDVGDQSFQQAATIVGRVVDGGGNATGIGWRVYADSLGGAVGADADSSRVSVSADAQTGEFRLEGVAPGLVELKAYARAANWIDGPKITVQAGDEASADIVYSGPDLGSRITVTTFCRKFFVYNDVEQGNLTARDASGRTYVGEKIEGSSQSYAINDLPPGEYTVEISSEFHRPWTQSGVSPGDTVKAMLEGSASIALDVTDAASGETLERYAVRIRFHEANFSPSVFDFHSAKSEPPPGGLFDQIIPAPITVVVEAEDFAPSSVVVDSLAPGESKAIGVALSKGATVIGRVVSSKGAGVAGATVLLHPHLPGYDPSDVFSGPKTAGARDAFKDGLKETTSDAKGGFRFDGLPAGHFNVQAKSGQLQARFNDLVLKGPEEREVTLSFPAEGSIEGRILGLRNAPPKELLVIAYANSVRPRAFLDKGLATSPIAPDGSFHIEGLRAGSFELALYIPSVSVATSHSGSSGTQPAYAVLGQVEVTGDMSGVTLDATEIEPGTLTVSLLVNGAVAPNVRVTSRSLEGTKERYSTAALSNEDGIATIRAIFPGRYDLYANSLEQTWRSEAKDAVQIRPGMNTTFDFQLQVATRKIRILDAATLEPAAEARVNIDGQIILTTDAEGWIETTLSIGTHRIRSAKTRTGAETNFLWDDTGTEPVEIGVSF